MRKLALTSQGLNTPTNIYFKDILNTKLFISADDNNIYLQANIVNNNYFALGFGQTMVNTEMILW